jgi:pSer/pThr/pTyr-binding forkhead associated (FHA) protein
VGDVYCNNCGHRNPPGSNFCSSCGAVLETDAREDATITFFPAPPTEPTDEDLTVTLEDLPAGSAVLVVRRGPNAGARYALDQDVVTVGRHPDSDIFLDDITVSRRHVRIDRVPEGFEASDAGSLNGMYLNRERIDRQLLRNGDELQVGKFRLSFFQSAESD